MTTTASTAFRFTSRDLELFPDIEGVRYEIIDGELYVSRQPDEFHQYTCNMFSLELQVWSLKTGLGMAMQAPGLVLAPDENAVPDVAWISHQRRALARDENGHYRLAPELVVEVLSPGAMNERRDRDAKMSLYSRQRVQEYWIADWQAHRVEVYRPQDGELRLVATLVDGDELTSPLLPGFRCSISSLWAPPLDA